jgi:hypothetical protein
MYTQFNELMYVVEAKCTLSFPTPVLLPRDDRESNIQKKKQEALLRDGTLWLASHRDCMINISNVQESIHRNSILKTENW